MKEVSIDVQTGEETSRDLNAQEVAQIGVWSKIEEIVQDEENKRLAAKNSLIEKLGLTADEAKLLLS
jgi:predicted NUDIX family NTP pyrophosphohydrolase